MRFVRSFSPQPIPRERSSGRVARSGAALSHSHGAERSTTAATSPPSFSIPAATAGRSGPHPATMVRRPGSTACDFRSTVAAASPMTPGRVQPGKGTTRSQAPVAAMSRGARKHSFPSGPTASMRKPFVIDQTRRPRRISTADPARRARSASPWRASVDEKRPLSPGHGARQTWPPADGCSSISTTDNPTRAAMSAALLPAGPAPMTTRSTVRFTVRRAARRSCPRAPGPCRLVLGRRRRGSRILGKRP